MQENIASALCYLLGWVTGTIFLVIEKRRAVRFHAAQSIVVFGGLTVLYWILASFAETTVKWGDAFAGWLLGLAATWLLGAVAFLAWIFLMVKAYQGQQFRVLIAAEIADSLVGKR